MGANNLNTTGYEAAAAVVAPQPAVQAGARRRLRALASSKVVFLTLLGVTALVFRLWPLQIAHWWDETAYLQNAEAIFFGKLNYSELAFRPPLLSILFGLAFKVWHHAFAASLVVAVLNAAGVVFMALAARRLYGRTAGAMAGLMLAFAPFLADTSRTLMTDNPCLSLVIISLYFVAWGIEQDRAWRSVLAGVFLAASCLMRFTALLSVPLVLALTLQGPSGRRRAAITLAAFAAAFSPYLIWSKIRLGAFFEGLVRASQQVGDFNESTWFYARNFPVVFSWVILAGVACWLLLYAVRPDLVRVGRSWTLAIRFPSSFPEIRQDVLLLAWAAILIAYFNQVPHRELRYIVPAAAPLVLLAAKGWSSLIEWRVRAAVVAAIFGALIIWGVLPAIPRFQQPFINLYVTDEMGAAQYLESLPPPRQAVLYVNHNFPVFGYYTRLPIRITPRDSAFYEVLPKNMPERGYSVFYKDGRAPSIDSIERNPNFRRLREFPSLVVYSYQPPPQP